MYLFIYLLWDFNFSLFNTGVHCDFLMYETNIDAIPSLVSDVQIQKMLKILGTSLQ